MPPSHLLLALAVVFVWGTNFVVIRHGLTALPPFVFATLRFAFSALPWLLFIKRPAVRWRWLALFGVLLGAGQFGLLFYAMRADISPGVASLLLQTQVFFTIGLAMLKSGERIRLPQVGALLLAVAGIAVIASHLGGTITRLGICLALLASFCWACANMVVREVGRVDMLGFMVWSSVFAVPPLALLSWFFHGPYVIRDGLSHAGVSVWLAAVWQAVGNTLFGYGVWNWLLSRHPAATVAPMSLLVPVFGMSASALLLGEPLPLWKLGAAALVLAGLVVNVVATRPRAKAL